MLKMRHGRELLDLAAEERRLADRGDSLRTIAVLGAVAGAFGFTAVLLASRDLVVLGMGLSPAVVAFGAYVWDTVTRWKLRKVRLLLHALGSTDARTLGREGVERGSREARTLARGALSS
jgi:hypothetical protein